MRHGHGPQRAIQTGVGPVKVRRAKVRDRADVAAEEKIRFTSLILPKRARRTKSLDALLPILYLRTSDFQEASPPLLGKHAPGPVSGGDRAADGGVAGSLRVSGQIFRVAHPPLGRHPPATIRPYLGRGSQARH